MMRVHRRIALVLGLLALGCAGTGPWGSGARDDGHDPYDRDGLSRHDVRVLSDEQALEQRRLQRLQEKQREELRTRQEERREKLEAAGDWDQRDARRQKRARDAQRERQEEQREGLREHHDLEWDRYGD